jgi:hypothetical protein
MEDLPGLEVEVRLSFVVSRALPCLNNSRMSIRNSRRSKRVSFPLWAPLRGGDNIIRARARRMPGSARPPRPLSAPRRGAGSPLIS